MSTEKRRILFAERLQHLLDAKGWSQEVLHHESGLAESTISRLLNGKQSPGARTISRIAAAFECEVAYLRDGVEPAFAGCFADDVQAGKETLSEPTTAHVRNYREISELDEDVLKEIQTWLNDCEAYRPGFTAWFRVEFQNRFPEFDDWKMKQFKKAE